MKIEKTWVRLMQSIHPLLLAAFCCLTCQAQGTIVFGTNISGGTFTNNAPSYLKMLEPRDGAVFPAGRPIQIAAESVAWLSFIRRVEFYAGTNRVGVSEIDFVQAPPPGVPIIHSIVWSNAPTGLHRLTAQAVDAIGRPIMSDLRFIKVGPVTDRPTVALELVNNLTSELNGSTDPGKFRIRRVAGPTNEPVLVSFQISGLAVNGIDYEAVSSIATIPIGEMSKDIIIFPLVDNLVEGLETATFTLNEAGCGELYPGCYNISGERAVDIFIQDGPQQTNHAPYVVITSPTNGQSYNPGEWIEIRAEGFDQDGRVVRTEAKIDDSPIADTNGPILLAYTNASPGIHVITAYARDNGGAQSFGTSVSVVVRGTNEPLPVVSISSLISETVEGAGAHGGPFGRFRLTRTGSTAESLVVRLQYDGSATPALDYDSLPNTVRFAPGAEETNLVVFPVDDSIREPVETVVARLMPPESLQAYIINTNSPRAVVSILDNDTNTPIARIEITKPENGAVFPLGQTISIDAVAVDPNSYIPRVEFYDGTNRIGVSEIAFLVPPAPGTPITHTIVWSNAPAGSHRLIARGVTSNGTVVISPAVEIRVGEVSNRVLLKLEVLDAVASEPSLNRTSNPALFRIRQVAGPTNEPISVWIQLSGTAIPGIDYDPVNAVLRFPTNRSFLDIPIYPRPDNLTEGEETVFLTLRPSDCGETNGITLLPFVPLPSCYGIFGTNMGRAIIRDSSETSNRPPVVSITSPIDGAVFQFGQTLEIRARAEDPDGFISVLELGMDGLLIGFTNGPSHTVWTNPPVGEHVFTAIATDNLGTKRESIPVRILVRETNTVSFAQRQLPAGYIPGTPFIVRIQANVPAGTQAWGLEDRPPQGWTVSEISNGGVYDPTTGKVKFGHYLEGGTRTLSYTVRPPVAASGVVEFSGIVSLDGRTYPIGGQRTISAVASEFHPADSNHDRRIILSELTGYAAAWKRGTNWPGGPNPIPATYVTHAALIWRQGETYTFLPTNPPPQCWVPSSGGIRALIAATATAATRTIAAGEDITVVTLQVQPSPTIGAFTVEEKLPSGWTVLNLSGDGVYDPVSRVVRWGLYMDPEPRTLSYSLVPQLGNSSANYLFGEVTLDGETLNVVGDSSVVPADGSAVLNLPATEIVADGSVKFRLAGPSGGVCDLESSADLLTWTFVTEVFLPDGKLDYTDYTADQTKQRYYRLRAR